MTIPEQLLTTPLSVVTDIVPSIPVCSIDTIDGQCTQIAQTNKQISMVLNSLSDRGVTIGDLLASIGSKSLPGAVMAMNAIQDVSPNGILSVDNALALLSMIDIGCRGTADAQQLLPAGRKSRGGVQQALQASIGIIDSLPLPAAWKLALRTALSIFSGSLSLFAPEIWEIVIFGIKSVEYELIELVIDKIFRDNAQPGDDMGCCLDMLATVKSALLTSDGKPLINGVTQALRAGLLDYARNTASDETNSPVSIIDGVPVTLDRLPLIDKLLKAISTPRRLDGNPVDVDGKTGTNGVQIARIPSDGEAAWEIWEVLEKALLRYKRNPDGSYAEDINQNPVMESIFPERFDDLFIKAFLKQAFDNDGQPITDASGNAVYVSRFDFVSSDVSSTLKECFKRPKVDDNGQPLTDADGLPLYADSYLSDIVDELNQTTEVWTLDGVRLFLRDRLIEYT